MMKMQLQDMGQVRVICPFEDKTVEISLYRFRGNLFILPANVMMGGLLKMRKGKIADRAAKFATFKKALRDLLTKAKPTTTEIIALEL